MAALWVCSGMASPKVRAASIPQPRRAWCRIWSAVTAADGVIVGRALRIDADGRLIIRAASGTTAVVAGSVTLA